MKQLTLRLVGIALLTAPQALFADKPSFDIDAVLDLAERAELALRCLTNNLDPSTMPSQTTCPGLLYRPE